MKFNRTILYKSYKNIVKKCINDGYSLPVLIKNVKVPHQYCYTLEHKKGLIKKTDDPTRTRLYTMIQERKKELANIQNNNSVFKSLDEYYEYELFEFLKEYPEFKDIIIF